MLDLAARASTIAAQGRARQAANRAKAPCIAALWDQIYPVFGMPAAIDLVDETTGHHWKRGELTPDTGRTMNADQWLHYVSTGEKP